MRCARLGEQRPQLGQAVFPDGNEFTPVVADDLLWPTTALDGCLRDLGYPCGGSRGACDGRQGIAGIIIHEDADVHCAAIAQGGVLESNVPLDISTALFIPLVGHAVRTPREGVALDGQPQAVEDVIDRLTADLADLPGIQFGGNAVAAPAKQTPQGEDDPHYHLRHLVVDGVRPRRLGAQCAKARLLGQAMPLPDATGA